MRVSKRTELEAAMGPLEGIRIVELAGIGPGPFCAMLLSDMGAEVIRVDRAAIVGQDTDRDGNDARYNLLSRGRRNIAVDLENAAGVDATLRLIDRADALSASGGIPHCALAGQPAGGRTGRLRVSPGATAIAARSRRCCTQAAKHAA